MCCRSSYVSSLLLKTWAREGTLGGIYISSEITSCCDERPQACSRPPSAAVGRQSPALSTGQAGAGPRRAHLAPAATCSPCRSAGPETEAKQGMFINQAFHVPSRKRPAGEPLQGAPGCRSSLLCSLPPPALTGPAPLLSINLLFHSRGFPTAPFNLIREFPSQYFVRL